MQSDWLAQQPTAARVLLCLLPQELPCPATPWPASAVAGMRLSLTRVERAVASAHNLLLGIYPLDTCPTARKVNLPRQVPPIPPS